MPRNSVWWFSRGEAQTLDRESKPPGAEAASFVALGGTAEAVPVPKRFAKPLYGLTPVPRVRIPPSPPEL
jgi:hypothetical protein